MASKRRLGPRNSDVSQAILDATERVLREEGYGAATSRRIAEVAGIRQGLVYYYFPTIDDVLLECFKRRTASGLARYQQEVLTNRPVQAIWQDLSENVDGRLVFEFVALANHHQGIREEVNRFVGEARRLQADAIARDAKARGVDMGPATPTALAFIMYSATLMMAREASTGLTDGHDDVRALFSAILEKFS